MPRFPRFARVWLLLCVAAVSAGRAEWRLACRVEGADGELVGLDRGRILVRVNGKVREAPAEVEWRLDGEASAADATVVFSPHYSLAREDTPPGEAARWAGSVVLIHRAEQPGRKGTSPLLGLWPGGIVEEGLAVFAWVVDGRPTAVTVRVMPATTKGRDVAARGLFSLDEAGARGQGVMLLWTEGGFVAPVALFPDRAMAEAARGMLLGDEAVLEKWIAGGGDVRAAGRDGVTLLHLAAEAGRVEAVKRLLAAGADANGLTGGTRASALQWAAEKGRLEVARALLAAGAEVNAASRNGDTALHRAVAGRHAEVAELLLAAGARAGVENRKGTRRWRWRRICPGC